MNAGKKKHDFGAPKFGEVPILFTHNAEHHDGNVYGFHFFHHFCRETVANKLSSCFWIGYLSSSVA